MRTLLKCLVASIFLILLCNRGESQTAGNLDLSFSNDGVGYYNASQSANGTEITKAIRQPDGKIVLAGEAEDGVFIVTRLNSNGTPDNGFGLNGFQLRPLENDGIVSSIILLASIGKTVIANT